MRADKLDIKQSSSDILSMGGTTITDLNNLKNLNILINSGFNVTQRQATSVTVSGDYPVDRWRFTESSSGAYTVEQSTDVPNDNANYSLKGTVNTADTSVDAGDWVIPFQYIVEGYDVLPLVGKTATLSFYIKSNLTGTYSVAFRNSGADSSYVIDYTINQADTWEKKVMTLPMDSTGGTWNYTNGIGLNLYWAGMVGSARQASPGQWIDGNALGSVNQVNWAGTVSNTLYLAEPQLEMGSDDTEYRPRIVEQELALCQRYFLRITDYQFRVLGNGTGTGLHWPVLFPVKMRTSPSLSYANRTLQNTTWNSMTNFGTGSGFYFDLAADAVTAAVGIASIDIIADAELL